LSSVLGRRYGKVCPATVRARVRHHNHHVYN